MLMTNGIGASVGTLIVGSIVNHYCSWQTVDGNSYMLGDWSTPWYIFAGYSLIVAILFSVLFKYHHIPVSDRKIKTAEAETVEIE